MAIHRVFALLPALCGATTSTYTQTDIVSPPSPISNSGASPISATVTFDYDGDGDDDVLMCNFVDIPGLGPDGADLTASMNLFKNNGDGTFTDVTATSGLAGHMCWTAVAGDINNDGHEDLVACNPFPGVGCEVFLGKSDGTFEAGAMIPEVPFAPGGATLGDWNRDGCLDLFIPSVSNLACDQVAHDANLYTGDCGGNFVKTIDENNVWSQAHFACLSSFVDLDSDGYLDLVVARCNDVATCDIAGEGDELHPLVFPGELYLFKGTGDAAAPFVYANVEFGVGERFGFWMGLSFGDFNNDGHIDFYAGQWGRRDCPGNNQAVLDKWKLILNRPDLTTSVCDHALFLNQGDGTFQDVTALNPLINGPDSENNFNWGSAFVDADNDGHQDFVVVGNAGGFGDDSVAPTTGRLFLNNHGGFPVPSEDLGIDVGSGLAISDLNGDGCQDIAINTWFLTSETSETSPNPVPQVPKVMINNCDHVHNRHWGHGTRPNKWIKIRLSGGSSNANVIGATVKLVIRGRRKFTQSQVIATGNSFGGGHSKTLTFGLGRVFSFGAKIKVLWPSGCRSRKWINLWWWTGKTVVLEEPTGHHRCSAW